MSVWDSPSTQQVLNKGVDEGPSEWQRGRDTYTQGRGGVWFYGKEKDLGFLQESVRSDLGVPNSVCAYFAHHIIAELVNSGSNCP